MSVEPKNSPNDGMDKRTVTSSGKPGYKRLKDISGLLDRRGIIIADSYLPKGTKVSLHWHDYFEYEIILDGELKQIYNGENFEMSRGWAYLMSYHDCHEVIAAADTRLLNIRFNENPLPDEILNYITVKPNRLICEFGEDETISVISAIERLGREISGTEIFRDVISCGIISELLIMLIRRSGGNADKSVSRLIQRAAACINTEFREKISLEMLANRFSVSVNYLGSLFKKNMGTSFNEYLNNVRLRYACSLLQSSELSVKEVAFASGYNSTEYFLYIFKKKMGMTPREYKTLHKNGGF